MAMFAQTTNRVSEELGRQCQYSTVNVDSANVPSAERRLGEYNTCSMVGLDHMSQASGLSPMELFKKQYEQNLQRGAQAIRVERRRTRAQRTQRRTCRSTRGNSCRAGRRFGADCVKDGWEKWKPRSDVILFHVLHFFVYCCIVC